MKSVNYTSSLPADILDLLDDYSVKFKVPKNRIIEDSLKAYFEKLKRAEYAHSFKRASGDPEMMDLAEEGLEDYLKIIDEP
jgi:hypothetical protein